MPSAAQHGWALGWQRCPPSRPAGGDAGAARGAEGWCEHRALCGVPALDQVSQKGADGAWKEFPPLQREGRGGPGCWVVPGHRDGGLQPSHEWERFKAAAFCCQHGEAKPVWHLMLVR